MYRKYFKPLLDISASLVLLMMISPIFVTITIALFVQNRGKPFFFQARPGKDKRPFFIIKFKTMNDEIGLDGNLLPDNERLTPLGKLLRSYSLDEIPQLINVIRGEMSLIGPRPLLFKYLPLYNEKHVRRHEVLPGITGLAQVSGRNSLSWSKKFDYDVEYVDKISCAFDLKIFFKTFLKVVKKEGVNQTDFRPMEPFNGSN